MAGTTTNLVSGANALIVINDKKMVMAQDLNYSVRVDVLPVEVMGSYEVVAYEPIGYSVSGSFSIVRYMKAESGETSIKNTDGAKGNSPSSIGLSDHMNPGRLSASTTFNIYVYKKGSTAGAGEPGKEREFISLTECRITGFSSSISKRAFVIEQYQFVAKLYDDEVFEASETPNKVDLDGFTRPSSTP